jgi:hypothetical protein
MVRTTMAAFLLLASVVNLVEAVRAHRAHVASVVASSSVVE